MDREVHLSRHERGHLLGFLGARLVAVLCDGWAVEIQLPTAIARFEPLEIQTPDELHLHASVVRPSLTVLPVKSSSSMEVVRRELGNISEIYIHVARATFSPPRGVEETVLQDDVSIPAWVEYHLDFCSFKETSDAPGIMPISLDIAVEFRTSLQHCVLVFSDGISFFCHLLVDDDASVESCRSCCPPAPTVKTLLETEIRGHDTHFHESGDTH
jgi:hypothetical protein